MTWLTDTPVSIIQSLVSAMPRLQAEECLQGVTVGAIGAGTLDESSRKSLLRSWEQAIGRTRQALKRRAMPMTPEAMAAFGISVVFEPPSAAPKAAE